MIIFILLLLSAGWLGASYFAYRVAFLTSKHKQGGELLLSEQYDPYRPRMRQIHDNLVAIPYETVTIQSFDGLTLYGRYYHTADGAPLDICFHGYRSDPVTDFSGGSEMSFALGHNVLMIEQRAHGRSDGETITFGILERRDLLSWVAYANARFGTDADIFLYGVSMGGATVLMAADMDLPENVRGIIADCPYAVPEEIIMEVGKGMHLPPLLIKYLARTGAYVFGGFHLTETDALRAAKNAKVPILILHGDDDRYVPYTMSLKVRDVNPQMVTHYLIPTAAHGIAYLVDTGFYQEKVREFLEKCLV